MPQFTILESSHYHRIEYFKSLFLTYLSVPSHSLLNSTMKQLCLLHLLMSPKLLTLGNKRSELNLLTGIHIDLKRTRKDLSCFCLHSILWFHRLILQVSHSYLICSPLCCAWDCWNAHQGQETISEEELHGLPFWVRFQEQRQ